MSRAELSFRPFVSMFVRPAALLMAFLLLMALMGSLMQLDSVALDLAFAGAPRIRADPALVAQTARDLVIHATAIVSAALGLIVMVTASEIEASPRLAIAPHFYAIMRRGSLLAMAVSPAIVWLWAHRWASPSALLLAMLWMPWWFSIGFWDRSLMQTPRAVRMVPVALLLVMVIRSQGYVAFVLRAGWWTAALLIAPAIYAVVSRWSASRRAMWMELTDDGTKLNWFTRWMVDRSNRLDVAVPPGTQRGVRWWLAYLRAERAENQRMGTAQVMFHTGMSVFVYITGTTPILLFMNSSMGSATVGRTLHHPIPRPMRAKLQFLEQLRDLLIAGIAMWTTFLLCDGVGVPRLDLASSHSIPFALQLASALVMSPVTQLGRATTAHTVDPKEFMTSQLWKFAGTWLVYMIATMFVLELTWRRTGESTYASLRVLGVIGLAMQLLCYVALRRYFATANLAPVAA